MAFSSIPVYLDIPHNWHQQQNYPLGNGNTEIHAQLSPLPPPPLQFGIPNCGGGANNGSGESGTTSSIKTNSMVDRARMAKIVLPQPETALKCPRCESTHTKFCYFNNYSLSQPRHFCKTCRRYWTRGGALRSVPVGGGLRRNKKTKTTKSQVSLATSTENHPQQMRYNPNHQSIYVVETIGNPSLNEIQQAQSSSVHDQMGYLMNISGGMGMDQWRGLQQIPFLGSNGGFESSSTTIGLYPFQNTTEGVGNLESQIRSTNSRVTSTNRDQVPPPVKDEDSNLIGVSMTIPFSGISENNNNNDNNNNQQFWGGNAWKNLSCSHNSSSTSHLI